MRVECFKGVLSPDTCRTLMTQGASRLSRSVVITAKGTQEPEPFRTSDGAWFGYSETPEVLEAELGICFRCEASLEHLEGLQILRYLPGQEFKPHQDTFERWDPGRQAFLGPPGQRLVSGVYMLSPARMGGELVFPSLGLTLRQGQGDLVLFWGTKGDSLATPDPMALHASVPVIQGRKWALTGWCRENPYRVQGHVPPPIAHYD